MDEKIRKYARFLLQGCLGLTKNDRLFIIADDIIQDFVNVVIEEAHQMEIVDIETLIQYRSKQKELFLTCSYEEIIASPLMDKTKYNKMARQGYAFLNLQTS